ncbi:MAG: hypothetical protein II980_00925 [Clostridia bacterium]|nr:hypothetical protein [Clostridia bacterium]
MKYTKPTYEKQELESKDIITVSSVQIEDAGEGQVNDISGKKGVMTSFFDWIS